MGKTAEGAEEALQLFRTLGKGFRLLSVYRCQVCAQDTALSSFAPLLNTVSPVPPGVHRRV